MRITTERTMELDLEKDMAVIIPAVKKFFDSNSGNLEIKKVMINEDVSYFHQSSITEESYFEEFKFPPKPAYVIQPKIISPLGFGDVRKITYINESVFEIEIVNKEICKQDNILYSEEVVKQDYKTYKIGMD